MKNTWSICRFCWFLYFFHMSSLEHLHIMIHYVLDSRYDIWHLFGWLVTTLVLSNSFLDYVLLVYVGKIMVYKNHHVKHHHLGDYFWQTSSRHQIHAKSKSYSPWWPPRLFGDPLALGAEVLRNFNSWWSSNWKRLKAWLSQWVGGCLRYLMCFESWGI